MIQRGGWLALTVSALVLSAVSGRAEETTAPKAGTVGVVDMDRVEHETAVGKDYLKQIEALAASVRAEGVKRQERLAQMGEEIQRQNDALRKSQAGADPLTASDAQLKLARLVHDRDFYQQDSEQEMARLERKLQRDTARLHKELREKLVPSIRGAMRESKTDVLLDNRICLAVGPSADLTDAVIRLADAAQQAAGTAGASSEPKTE
jgi:Skp family chaperone for outer membrane proteins